MSKRFLDNKETIKAVLDKLYNGSTVQQFTSMEKSELVKNEEDFKNLKSKIDKLKSKVDVLEEEEIKPVLSEIRSSKKTSMAQLLENANNSLESIFKEKIEKAKKLIES